MQRPIGVSGAQHYPASSCPVTLAVHEVLGEVANYQGYFVTRRTPAGFEKVDLNGRATIVPKHFPEQWQDSLRNLLRRA
jgi:hypothetical protein